MTRWRLPAAVGLSLVLASPGTLWGQEATGPADGPEARALLRDDAKAAWVRPVASLLVPGTGQLLGGRSRGAVYLVAEALLITRALTLNSEGRRDQERYRELATVVARGPFDPVLQDTVFEYFEQMGRWVESGPFDTDSGPLLVPPEDERTYNGQIWALARKTFFPDPASTPARDSPEYQRAEAFYRARAIGPNFRWSWRNAGLEQDLYRQTISASDEAFRGATTTLGILLVNHLLSAVDAFITERLSRPGRSIGLHTGLWPPGGRGRRTGFTAVVSVGL